MRARLASVSVFLLCAIYGSINLWAPTSAASAGIRFRNATTAAGLNERPTRSWGSSWADFRGRDGLPDLFVGRHGRPPWLFANVDGTRFRRIGEDFHPGYMDRHGCAWGEANGDGRADFYCTQGADQGHGEGDNQLWIARSGGFTDRAAHFHVKDSLGRGRTVNWIDYDVDGDLDLFVGNEYRRGVPNVLFRNRRQGFDRVETRLAEELRTVNSTWADWDRDGDPDVLVLQKPPRRTFAYENRQGTFRRRRLPEVTGRAWMSAAWGDYNGDGWTDLHLVTDSRSVIVRNGPRGFRVVHRSRLRHGRMSTWVDVDNDGRLDAFVVQGSADRHPRAPGKNARDFLIVRRANGFRRLARRSFRGYRRGYGDAVSTADYNRDGRVDLFVSNGYGPRPASGRSMLLKNISDAGNWLGLELVGRDSNPFAFGARVLVLTDRFSYRRQLTDNFNFRAQAEVGYLHLGLRREDSARIVIRWPSGARDCFRSSANLVVVVRVGSHACGQSRRPQ